MHPTTAVLIIAAFCATPWLWQTAVGWEAVELLPGTLAVYESLPGQLYAGQMKVQYSKV
jgi:hypothetical protein